MCAPGWLKGSALTIIFESEFPVATSSVITVFHIVVLRGAVQYRLGYESDEYRIVFWSGIICRIVKWDVLCKRTIPVHQMVATDVLE